MTVRKDITYKKSSDAKLYFGYRSKVHGSYDTTGFSAQFIVKSGYDPSASELFNLTTSGGEIENRPSEELQFVVSLPRTADVSPGSYPGEFWITDVGGARPASTGTKALKTLGYSCQAQVSPGPLVRGPAVS